METISGLKKPFYDYITLFYEYTIRNMEMYWTLTWSHLPLEAISYQKQLAVMEMKEYHFKVVLNA